MSKVIRKWFWVWQQEQERAFLEEMSRKGLRLARIALGKYTFEEDSPRKMIYQMDFRGLDGKVDEKDYLQIYADSGWDYIGKAEGWYYFSQEHVEGVEASIFNDNASQAKVYQRLLVFLLLTGFPLYYQTLFLFPRTLPGSLYYPCAVIFAFLTGLHFIAVLKLLGMYRKTRDRIKE